MLVLVTGGAPGSLPSWCSPALLVLAGRRSYALYLWHLPLLLLVTPHVILVRPLLPHTVLLFPLALVAAWGVTLLSWRYVEEPALRWRRRLVATADCSAQPSARRLRELAESG
jgi:peptidoglycan/LPS O-acetylase OafA/YrhL